MDELEIYKRQGFAQRVGLGHSPALVIVDFVVGFTDPAHFGGGNILPAIDTTTRLLAFARDAGWPVAHTRVIYADDGSDAGVFARKEPGELVVRKQQASAFFGTGFASWLTGRGADTLVVAGCTTSGCVRATVVDSVAHNLRTIVPTDCVGDRALAPHEANLFDMGQKYADLMTLPELMAACKTEGRALPRQHHSNRQT